MLPANFPSTLEADLAVQSASSKSSVLWKALHETEQLPHADDNGQRVGLMESFA